MNSKYIPTPFGGHFLITPDGHRDYLGGGNSNPDLYKEAGLGEVN